jgi:hypothetical protein
MRRWQYKVVQQKILLGQGGSEAAEDRNLEAMLDRYGREGWELVSVAMQSYRRDYDSTSLQGYSFFSYFLKREVPSE